MSEGEISPVSPLPPTMISGDNGPLSPSPPPMTSGYGWKSEREIKAGKMTKEEWQKFEELWDSTETYSDVINLNMKFLRGDINYTPYHLGPLDPETEPLVPDLLKLHEYGVLTITGQPADYQFLRRTRSSGSYFVQFEQRAVIEFLIPGDPEIVPQHSCKKFLELIKGESQWDVFIGSVYPEAKVLHCSLDDEGFTTTRKRKAATKEEIAEQDWKDCGHFKIPMDGPEIQSNQHWIKESVQLLRDMNLSNVILVSKDWDPQMEIEPRLVKLAEKAGMTTKFDLQLSE
ncbi:hypothetical protein EV356DRAFT_521087 [Viridothelium virens]|uniref:DUF6919 domain-containing protein n=1 Tax=Viridothelium virens TaxID=1048519 RepID=A0A6A6GUH8_VIRVR|nr:hypothetical protein EV356DRAFT_521087 [Viridothelium virens]